MTTDRLSVLQATLVEVLAEIDDAMRDVDPAVSWGPIRAKMVAAIAMLNDERQVRSCQ
jgi:hypothetical protein